MKIGRNHSLDSLRGIAALTVVFSHLFITFKFASDPIQYNHIGAWLDPVTWMRYSPLRTFFGGRPAVVFFFVLSGYVLSLKFLAGRAEPYFVFIWRRFCRIYIPFLVAILFAFFIFSIAPRGPVDSLSEWFNTKSWFEPPSLDLLFRHLAMTGQTADMSLNNVMWSLVHEIRVSMLFPLLMLIVLPSSIVSIVVAFAVYWAGTFLIVGDVGPEWMQTWFATLAYSAFFMVGALLAKHSEWIAQRRILTDRWAMLALFAFVLCAFAMPAGVIGAEFLYGFASVSLISLALANIKVRGVLEMGPIHWLGRVSFSLYLVHLPVLLLSFRLLEGQVNRWVIVGLVLVVSLVLAEVYYRLVEVPAMWLGRHGLRTVVRPKPAE